MLYSSTVLALQRVLHSRLLATPTHLSHLSTELAFHPLLFAFSVLPSSGSAGSLSAPLTQPAAATTTDALIACSLAFFRKEQAVLFRGDIPGRPETPVRRWHAMRNRRMDEREKAGQGGEVVGLADEEDRGPEG